MDVLLAEAEVAANPEGGHLALLDQSVDGHPGYAQEVSDLVHGQQPSLGEGFSPQGPAIVREEPAPAIAPRFGARAAPPTALGPQKREAAAWKQGQ
jgi:hypothetical protein